MPVNAHPDYLAAEKEYLLAETIEEKIKALKKMISLAPKHKGAENLRAQLKIRYKKLKEKLNKNKQIKKSSTKGIKKGNFQVVIIGKENSGKSTLLKLLTNTKPKISEIPFSTKNPAIGIANINSIDMQIIENPAINSEYHDRGLTNSADCLVIIINDLNDLSYINNYLNKATNKKIILYNLKKTLSKNELRKLHANMKSKKLDFVILDLNNPNKEELNNLKNKLFYFFDKIRVYTKEPGKKEKSEKPIILPQNSCVKDATEKILKGLSKKIKSVKIWGPSSKFPGQVVGLKHQLKDMDIIEFKTI